MSWAINYIPTAYPIFVAYYTITKSNSTEQQKTYPVINLQDLNSLVEPNMYLLRSQEEIINMLQDCKYISC